jgi:hypothetical protein
MTLISVSYCCHKRVVSDSNGHQSLLDDCPDEFEMLSKGSCEGKVISWFRTGVGGAIVVWKRWYSDLCKSFSLKRAEDPG